MISTVMTKTEVTVSACVRLRPTTGLTTGLTTAGWQSPAWPAVPTFVTGMPAAYATEPFTAGTFADLGDLSLMAGASVKQTATKAAAHAAKRNDATLIGTNAPAPPG